MILKRCLGKHWLHSWGSPVHVTAPLFDIGARGLLWRCTREGCEEVKAR